MSPSAASDPAPADPDLVVAEHLLDGFHDDPVARARRIAGLYAALYLEDPLLHQWGGLAAFVARHVHLAMESAGGLFEDFMAKGNLDIYTATMPAFMRLRRGEPAVGPLRFGMNLLARADHIALLDVHFARRVADRGLTLLTEIEQTDIVQPAYDELGGIEARLLAPFMRFRLGWDSAAPVVDFDEKDGRKADQRLDWALGEVVPAWRQALEDRPALIRMDLDRIRRWANVKDDELPPRGPVGRPSLA